jgi:hypothetical protein
MYNRYWPGAYHDTSKSRDLECIESLYAGESILEFHWRALDNKQRPRLECFYHINPHLGTFDPLEMEKIEKGAIWIGATIEPRSSMAGLKTPPM